MTIRGPALRRAAGVLASTSLAGSAGAETKSLVEPDAVAAAHAVSAAIDALSNAVMTCVTAGEGEPADCLCLHRDRLSALESAYEEAMSRYPERHDRVVFFTLEGDPFGYNVAFDGVRRQLEAEPCPGN